MQTFIKTSIMVLTLTAGTLAITTSASAQSFRYRYPDRRPAVGVPYGPNVYAPYAGRGGQLAGAANVINAQGEFMNQEEQARVTREKAYQEYLQSKKQTFQLNKYIEANTPTFGEKQEKNKGMRTRRILNSPTQPEINSGEALNSVLAFLQSLGRQGAMGAPVALDSHMLANINVASPADKKGSLTILRNGGTVDWPIAVRGNPIQKELVMELPKAVNAAARDTLTLKQYQTVLKDVMELREDVTKQYAKEKLDVHTFLTADEFLGKLASAVVQLQKPGIKSMLGNHYHAYGRNVQELVENMTRQGLQFVAASPGDEAAYTALHSAMAQYAVSINTSFGFQVQSVAPRKNFRVQN